MFEITYNDADALERYEEEKEPIRVPSTISPLKSDSLCIMRICSIRLFIMPST